MTRHTPLKPGGFLPRYKPLRKASPRQRRRQREWSRVTREAIEAAGGLCQIGLPGCMRYATQGHHKLPKSQGGRDTLSNCLVSCWHCHIVGTHANPAQAYASGAMVRRGGTI